MRRVTIVTGGSRGIGTATCRRLATAGHDVAVGYRSDPAAAEVVVADVRPGKSAVAIGVETADAGSVQALFDGTAAALGPVTGLVNNAGVGSPIGAFVDLDEADLRRVVDVNVIGGILRAGDGPAAGTGRRHRQHLLRRLDAGQLGGVRALRGEQRGRRPAHHRAVQRARPGGDPDQHRVPGHHLHRVPRHAQRRARSA